MEKIAQEKTALQNPHTPHKLCGSSHPLAVPVLCDIKQAQQINGNCHRAHCHLFHRFWKRETCFVLFFPQWEKSLVKSANDSKCIILFFPQWEKSLVKSANDSKCIILFFPQWEKSLVKSANDLKCTEREQGPCAWSAPCLTLCRMWCVQWGPAKMKNVCHKRCSF